MFSVALNFLIGAKFSRKGNAFLVAPSFLASAKPSRNRQAVSVALSLLGGSLLETVSDAHWYAMCPPISPNRSPARKVQLQAAYRSMGALELFWDFSQLMCLFVVFFS